MPKQYPKQVRDRAIKMVLDHQDEYDSIYKAALTIGPRVGVRGESLRRWVIDELAKGTPAGEKAAEQRAEAKKIKGVGTQGP